MVYAADKKREACSKELKLGRYRERITASIERNTGLRAVLFEKNIFMLLLFFNQTLECGKTIVGNSIYSESGLE